MNQKIQELNQRIARLKAGSDEERKAMKYKCIYLMIQKERNELLNIVEFKLN